MIKEQEWIVASPDFLLSQGFYLSIVERFLAKFHKNGPVPAHRPDLGPCWIWTAAINGSGYGSIGFGPKVNGVLGAHVVSWLLSRGVPLPCGKDICHYCDTRNCVNPKHLWAGTSLQNMSDMKLKNRSAVGERHGIHKLTWRQVAQIKAVYPAISMAGLAELHGVCAQTICRVIHGETWAHKP